MLTEWSWSDYIDVIIKRQDSKAVTFLQIQYIMTSNYNKWYIINDSYYTKCPVLMKIVVYFLNLD